MFDVTAQLVNDQEEIHGGHVCHWLVMKESSIFEAQVYVFSDSVLCLGRVLQHPDSNETWKNRVTGVKVEKCYRDYDGINGEPTECAFRKARREMIHDGAVKPEKVSSQEGADSEIFIMGSDAAEFVNKVNDQVRKRQKRMSNVAGAGEEHTIIWWMFMAVTMETAVFTGKNFQVNQISIANIADLTLKQMFDISSSIVLSEIEAEVPLENYIPSHQNLLLQRYIERIEML